jgi:hypothetical protein
MANPAGKQDDVVGATNKLMKALLAKAEADPDNVDFALSCVQSATRWIAVLNRMNVPEEGNSFDGWRAAIADGADRAGGAGGEPAGASPPSVERKARPSSKRAGRSGVIGRHPTGGEGGALLAAAFSTHRSS